MSNARKLANLMVGTELKISGVDSDLSNTVNAIKGRLDSDDSKIQSLLTSLETKISSIKTRLDSDDTKLQALNTSIEAGIVNLVDSDLITTQIQSKINSIVSNIDSDSTALQAANEQITLIKGRLDSDSTAIQTIAGIADTASRAGGVGDSDLKVVSDLRNELDSEILYVRNLTLSYTNYIYTATAGQTTFTGNDDNSVTLSYTAGAILVFLNGIKLEAEDFTATDGTSIVLTDPAGVSNELNIVCPKLESNYIPPLNWSAISLNTVLDNGPNPTLNGGNYGNKIDLAGDYAVVSAPNLSTGGLTSAGGIFIYKRSDSDSGTGWPQQTVIYEGNLYSNATNGDYFGVSVRLTDIAGTGILVSNANTGASTHKYNVYYYTRSGTTWSLAQTISPPSYGGASSGNQMEASNNDHGFGRDGRLDTDGDYFIVGAPTDDAGSDNKGSAWVYYYSSGSYAIQQELNGSDNEDGSRFGEQVSILGNTAVVGAPNQDLYNNNKGAVYIFTRSGSTWTQQQKIQPPTSGVHSPAKGMGKAISQDGDYIAIGCHHSAVGSNTNAGKVLIYKWSGSSYVIDGSVTASDAATKGSNVYFGQALDLRGNVLFVGAYGSKQGYIFTRSGTTWTEQKIVDSNPYETNASIGSTEQVKINKDTSKNEVLISANGKGAWLFTL